MVNEKILYLIIEILRVFALDERGNSCVDYFGSFFAVRRLRFSVLDIFPECRVSLKTSLEKRVNQKTLVEMERDRVEPH